MIGDLDRDTKCRLSFHGTSIGTRNVSSHCMGPRSGLEMWVLIAWYLDRDTKCGFSLHGTSDRCGGTSN